MNTRNAVLASIIAVAFAAPAMAQTTSPRDLNKDGRATKVEKKAAKQDLSGRFKAADKNNDGGLSREELRATPEFAGMEKNFDRMDANKDGKITLKERNDFLRATGKKPAAAKKKQEAQK